VIRTKSVHSTIEPRKDGLRILVTRLWGRGLPASRYDVRKQSGRESMFFGLARGIWFLALLSGTYGPIMGL
jgi:hypothetical protein